MAQNVIFPRSEESDANELLPCQFCGKAEPPDNLTLHQSGCKYNPYLPHSFGLLERDDDLVETPVELERIEATCEKLLSKFHSLERSSSSEAMKNISFKIKQMVKHDVFDITQKDDGGYMLKRVCDPTEEKTPETGECNSNPGDDEKTSETDESDSNLQHEENVNEQEMHQCEFCDYYLPSDIIDEHLKICENRPLECPKCSNLILWGEREAHDFICTVQLPDEDAFENDSERTEVNGVEVQPYDSVNHDDEDFELSDDNNEENETVERFIRKALLSTANLKRTVQVMSKNSSMSV